MKKTRQKIVTRTFPRRAAVRCICDKVWSIPYGIVMKCTCDAILSLKINQETPGAGPYLPVINFAETSIEARKEAGKKVLHDLPAIVRWIW